MLKFFFFFFFFLGKGEFFGNVFIIENVLEDFVK